MLGLHKSGMRVKLLVGTGTRAPSLADVPYELVRVPRIPIRQGLTERETRAASAAVGEQLTAELGNDRPAVFATTHHLGVRAELTPVFESGVLKESAKVLLWRDIPFAPHVWERLPASFTDEVIDTASRAFDQVLVLGDRLLFDISKEYSLPEVLSNKLSYVGYAAGSVPEHPRDESRLLVSVGGGENRPYLRDLVPRAVELLRHHFADVTVVDGLHESTIGPNPKVAAQPFMSYVSHLKLVSSAGVCVNAGGYNTVTECLSAGTPQALLVPASSPEASEFGCRASRLEALGLVNAIHSRLTDSELEQLVLSAPIPDASGLNMGGVGATVSRLAALV